MKPKQIFKVLLDIMMTVLFMILMAYHVTDNRQHEWLGVILFVLFILHHILNMKWYKGLFKGRYSAARVFMTVLNFMLLAAMIGMMVSGIMISYDVFGFLHLRTGMFGRRLHMTSTAWGYLLMSMHIGLHWGMVVGMVKRRLPQQGKWAGYIGKGIAVLISVYGVYALIHRELIERLFLRVHFAFFDYEEPVIYFFADYLSILILFAAVSYYLLKLIGKPGCKKEHKTKRAWIAFGVFILAALTVTVCVAKKGVPSAGNPVNIPEQALAAEETVPKPQPDSGQEVIPETVEENTTVKEAEPDDEILIAYFSLINIVPEEADAVTYATPSIGNTESAAMEIQRQVGGDLFAIRTVQNYPAGHQECSAVAEEEMRSDARPELAAHVEDMDKYNIVYIGYPVWWYVEPMAVRTFLEEYDFTGKTVIPFCTTMGAGIGKSEESIAALADGATILKGMALQTGREDISEEIASWLIEIGMSD
ncbi:MAG: DUF4405 domain-containing protein [Muribaculaceae bacterium]|nr:DUF4405 domain-containing protein [Muribaculaceae bacterium]